MPQSVTVTVPATTANIGPGFDCLGAALSLYNHFQFERIAAEAGTLTIQAKGTEADRVPTDSTNLVYRAFARVFQQLQQPVPAVSITIELGVPLARGLGSSSTAIVAGVVGANVLAGSPLSQSEQVDLTTQIEGHPDNVVPALIGGCQLAATDETQAWTLCDVPWHPDIVPVVVIPDFELSTAEARAVLPATYSRADAIFNTAHLGLLLRGLETGRADWLARALCDRIHQPYRQTLIPGFETVSAAAVAAGAHGVVISGAGPTLLALTSPQQAVAVSNALQSTWQQVGMACQAHVLSLDTRGAHFNL